MNFLALRKVRIPRTLLQAIALHLLKTLMLVLSEGKAGKVWDAPYSVMPFICPFLPTKYSVTLFFLHFPFLLLFYHSYVSLYPSILFANC